MFYYLNISYRGWDGYQTDLARKSGTAQLVELTSSRYQTTSQMCVVLAALQIVSLRPPSSGALPPLSPQSDLSLGFFNKEQLKYMLNDKDNVHLLGHGYHNLLHTLCCLLLAKETLQEKSADNIVRNHFK